MYSSRPVFLHPSALSPEEYSTFLTWVQDLRLPARPARSIGQKEAAQDNFAHHDIRVDDVGRFLLESVSLQEAHWEEILSVFYPAHRSLQPRHSASQSHLRSLSPFSSEEVFVVLRLAWHALAGRHFGLEGQSLIFRQAVPPSGSTQPFSGSMASTSSSISNSHYPVNNLSKLPPPPQHQARRASAPIRALSLTSEGKPINSTGYSSVYAKPSPFIRRSSLSSTNSDLSAAIALTLPPPPPPPPQRTCKVVSGSFSSSTARKASAQSIPLSTVSPLSSSSFAHSRSSESSSEDSDDGRRSGFDRLRYRTPMSDGESSVEDASAPDGEAKAELLLHYQDPSEDVSPNPALVLIDNDPPSTTAVAPAISSSNPFRARLHSTSMLPQPEFSTRPQSSIDRPVLSIVSPPLPPRPGPVSKPHSAPPLPPRESGLSSWASSSFVPVSATESEPPLRPTSQKAPVPSVPRSSVPKVPVKPSKLQNRPLSSMGTSTGFHTTMLIQQSLLAAEDARKKEQTKAERERRVEVIGSSTVSHGDGMTVGLGSREGERGSKWATVSAHTGLGKGTSAKGEHHYHHYHPKPLARSSISSFQALMQPLPSPGPSRLSSPSSTSSLAVPTSGHKPNGQSLKGSSSTAVHGTKPTQSTLPEQKAALSGFSETTSRTVPPPPLRRSSTLASLHSISSTSVSSVSTSHQPEREHSFSKTTKSNDRRTSAENTPRGKLRVPGSKGE